MSPLFQREPLQELGGDEVVAFAVGVVDLGHQVGERVAGLEAGFEGGEAIHEREAVVGRYAADLVGVLVEGIGGVVEFGGLVGGGRQQNELRSFGAADHGLP